MSVWMWVLVIRNLCVSKHLCEHVVDEGWRTALRVCILVLFFVWGGGGGKQELLSDSSLTGTLNNKSEVDRLDERTFHLEPCLPSSS